MDLVENGAVQVLAHEAFFALVDEALAVGAHQDHVGKVRETVEVSAGRGAVVLAHDGVVLHHAHHVVGVRQERACVRSGHQALALAIRVPDAERTRLLGIEARRQLGVVGVAAGGDHDSARLDTLRLSLRLDHRAFRLALGVQQNLHQLRALLDLHAQLVQAGGESRDETAARAVDVMHHLQGAVVDVDLIRELDAHAVDQPVDGLAAVLHRDLSERRVKMIRRVVHQVRIHRVVGELDALRLLQLGIPTGDHALGHGRSAADLVTLFDDQHVLHAIVLGFDRARHAGAAAAAHQQVDLGIPGALGTRGLVALRSAARKRAQCERCAAQRRTADEVAP